MALAFRRAVSAAEEAFAGYVSQYKDYYGFLTDKPITFDWDSAKAIAGESKFNSNEEVLPRSITVVNCIKDSPNYLSGMVSNIPYKATDEYKELAFQIMRRRVTSITMHFDDKSTKKGECTWTCEVRDGVLHATMHYNFDQYCGRQNYEDVCEWLITYLDDTEDLFFEIEKAKTIADAAKDSPWLRINSDTVGYLKDATKGKKIDVVLNWDEIKAVPGRSIVYSNKPPFRNSEVLLIALNEGCAYAVHWALDHVLKDDMGREAFLETFDSVHINARPAAAHHAEVVKSGKSVVFNFGVKLDDYQNCGRSYDYKVLGSAIENML